MTKRGLQANEPKNIQKIKTKDIKKKKEKVTEIFIDDIPDINMQNINIKKEKNIDSTKLQDSRVKTMIRDIKLYSLMEIKLKDNKYSFHLMNMENESTIKIKIDNLKSVSCSCSDFIYKCIHSQINCKHILYLLRDFLKLPLDFFKLNQMENVSKFLESIQKLCPDINLDNKAKINSKNVHIQLPICAKCFLPLKYLELGKPNDCTKCHNIFHKNCFDKNKDKNCVYCLNNNN